MTPKETPREERTMKEDMAWSHCMCQLTILSSSHHTLISKARRVVYLRVKGFSYLIVEQCLADGF